MIAALLGAAGVMLGAAGTHLISDDSNTIKLFEIALRYHMWHVFALLMIGTIIEAPNTPSRGLDISGIIIVTGVLCFSGSLYFRAFGGELPFPWITPLGGILLIAGWVNLAGVGWSIWRSK